MEDLVQQVWLIVRGMWLHRKIGLILVWIVGLIAGVSVFFIPDKYEATARIYVDTDSVLRPLMSGLIVQANTDQQIAMLSRTLISRPNLEKLIRMADLDLSLKSGKDKEALIDELSKTLKIKSVGRDNLYTLEYRDTDSERARKVVQSLTTIFVESSLGNKRSDTDSARKFLDEQITIYQKKLEEAEGRVKEYKLRNLDVQLDGAKGSTDRLSDLNNQLGQARLALREAEQGRDAIKRQLMEESSINSSTQSGLDSAYVLPEIDGRIDAQKRALDALLQRFTDQHPDVLGARRVVKELEEQKRQEIVARKKAARENPAAAPVSVNPAYQQIKVSLSEAEAQVASLRARVAEFDSRYVAAVSKMKMMPQVEAEYSQLNRDYDIIKKNYDDLVQRRESASISEGMAAVSGVADFRLIDPPRSSNKPVAPNRLLFLPLALVASLAVGMAGCFAASQLRPAFFEGQTLREVSGLAYLGSVSRVTTPEIQKQRRNNVMRFLSGLGGMVALYVVAIAVVFVLMSRQAG